MEEKPVSDKPNGTDQKEQKQPAPIAIKQPWVADLEKCPFTDLPDGKCSTKLSLHLYTTPSYSSDLD